MNSFSSKAVLTSGNRSYTVYRLSALAARGFKLARLPQPENTARKSAAP